MPGATITGATFFGMRDTERWGVYDNVNGRWIPGTEHELRPENWRDTLLYIEPNGMAPLTALMSRMKRQPTTDPQINWLTKSLPEQMGVVTGVFIDPTLATPYGGGAVTGTPLYLQVPEETARHFRVGHQALIRYTEDHRVDVNARVTSVNPDGPISIIGVQLLENDDNAPDLAPNGPGPADLQSANYVMVIGNVNPEGSGFPNSIAYEPAKWENYTQIFITPFELTRTALETTLRYSKSGGYDEAKTECLKLHSIEMEKAFLFGSRSFRFGDNEKPERTMMGLIPFIRTGGGHTSDYRWDPIVAGAPWADGAGDWLDYWCAEIFKWGTSRERVAYCGQGTLLALNSYVREHKNSRFEFTTSTKAYGIQVVSWVCVFGTIHFMSHPLFSYNPTDAYSAVIFDPTDLIERPLHDTEFIADSGKNTRKRVNTGYGWIDGIKEGFVTETSLEFHWPIKTAYLTGFGQDNLLPAP